MPPADRDLRLRLWWTALLVLFAFSAAGLAVAADRQHGSTRPELFWEAETTYGPWIDSTWERVRSMSESLGRVSTAGREALGTLQSLDPLAADGHLDAGDSVTQAMATDLETSISMVEGPSFSMIERWRLSPSRQAQLDAIESAISAARTIAGQWPLLSSTGRTMSQALQTLLRHDGLVFRATTAGRQSQWVDAIDLLRQAATELDTAAAARDSLAAAGNVDTLTDLLSRYAAYDAALTALYVYVRDTGRQEGDEFDRLRVAVTGAETKLPGSDDVLAVIVGESAAPALTAALLRIERARGAVLESLRVAPELAP